MSTSGAKPMKVCPASRSGPLRLSRSTAWGCSSRDAANRAYGSKFGSSEMRFVRSPSDRRVSRAEDGFTNATRERPGVRMLEEVPPDGNAGGPGGHRIVDQPKESPWGNGQGPASDQEGGGTPAHDVAEGLDRSRVMGLDDLGVELRGRANRVTGRVNASTRRIGHDQDGQTESGRLVGHESGVFEHSTLGLRTELNLDGDRVGAQGEGVAWHPREDLGRGVSRDGRPRRQMNDEPKALRGPAEEPYDPRVCHETTDRRGRELLGKLRGRLDSRERTCRDAVIEGREKEVAVGPLEASESTGNSTGSHRILSARSFVDSVDIIYALLYFIVP